MLMKPVAYRGNYFEVDTSSGTEIVPEDVIGDLGREARPEDFADFCEGRPYSYEVGTGILCRLSSSGYMDCTPWTACETVGEAREYLLSLLGDDDDGEAMRAVDSALRRL